jgi:hypothetical protein
VLAGVQFGSVGPGPARSKRSVDDADPAVDLVVQVGDELVEHVGDDVLEVLDRS